MRKTASTLPDPKPLLLKGSLLLLAALVLVANMARAQELPDLEELVAPIALYPDDVLAIVLPASTFPLEIVQAARFLEDRQSNPDLEPDEDWDDSVIALLNYPEIIVMMNEDLDWTWALGEAVLTDQAAVLAAAQDFRRRAYAAGNLESDDRQTVTETDGAIVIKPADPKVVYIPYYDPYEVVVYHSRPVYHYYPVAYPVYYYPYPVGYRFGTGFFFGVTSWFSIGWHSHYVHVHHHTHHLHPYYLNTYYYYDPYYYRSAVNITVNVNDYTNVWRASPRRGSRPGTITVSGRNSTRQARTSTVESQPGVTNRTLTSQATRTRQDAASSRLASGAEPSGQTRTATSRGADAAGSRRATLGEVNRSTVLDRRTAGTPDAARTPDTRSAPTRQVPSSDASRSRLRSVPSTPRTSVRPTTPAQPPGSSATRRVAPAPSTRAAAPVTRAPSTPAVRSAAPARSGAALGPVTRGSSTAAPRAGAATRSSSSSSSGRRQR